MFDYRKLDTYKVAIDDGAIFEFEYDLTWYQLKSVRSMYCFTCFDQIKGEYIENFCTKNFQILKRKIEEFFKEDINNVQL